MANTSYMEIPSAGISHQRSRTWRRSFITYRYCLGATALTVVAITVIAVLSVMIGRGTRGRNTFVQESKLVAAPPANTSLEQLLALSWPRRDSQWYHERWNSTMAKEHKPNVTKPIVPLAELDKIIKASPLSVANNSKSKNKRSTYRERMDRREPSHRNEMTLPPMINPTEEKENSPSTLPGNEYMSTEKSTGDSRMHDDWKSTENSNSDSQKSRNWHGMDWDDDDWVEDWKRDNEEKGYYDKKRPEEIQERESFYEENYGNNDAPDGDRWTTPDGSTFPKNDSFHWNRRPRKLPRISQGEVDRILADCSKRNKMLDSFEVDLVKKNLTLKKGSASHYHQSGFRKTSPQARCLSKQGRILEWATKIIKSDKGLSKEDVTFDCHWMSYLKNSLYCEHRENYRRFRCRKHFPYRSADGSCNNLKNPTWGKSFTAYRRLLPPDYGDGVSVPRLSKIGKWLPSARKVSTTVHIDTHHESKSYTHLTMVWGQLVDHDITATAASKGYGGESLTCCNNQVTLDPSYRHPECFPIQIPGDDPFFKQFSKTCMEFSRSSPAGDCQLGPRNQLNQLTAFLDGSVIYGSTQKQQDELRTHKDGLLRSQVTVDGLELLMASYDKNDSCNTESEMRYNRYCFKSGDARVNEHILLTIMHTLLVRQHNSLAVTLRDMNPHWDDDRLFQESRKILIAQFQHITYHEYIPSIIGPVLSKKLNISPSFEGKAPLYRDDVHPGIANGFAAAAYRFGHSMIQGLIQKIDAPGKSVSFEQTKKYFFSPFTLYDIDALPAFLRGIVSEMSHAVDTLFTSQITNRLFQPKDAKFGLDLVSINIQRGRDHGIPSYTRWRMLCGQPKVRSFDDLKGYMNHGALEKIKKVYKHVDDIDLYTGGLAENHLPDALVGPTFGCIITDQFLRLKIADRFWYETKDEDLKFTEAQLNQIYKSSLARLLCDNAEDMGSIQRWPMRKFSTGNPRLPCSSNTIPRVDIGPWEEGEI